MQNEVIEDYSYSKTPVQIPFHTRFDIWIDFGLNLSEISESLSFDLQGFKKPTTQNLSQVILNLRLVSPIDPKKTRDDAALRLIPFATVMFHLILRLIVRIPRFTINE